MRIKTLTAAALTLLMLGGCTHASKSEDVATIIYSNVSLKKASMQHYARNAQPINELLNKPATRFAKTKVSEPPRRQLAMKKAPELPSIQLSEKPSIQLTDSPSFEPLSGQTVSVELFETAVQYAGYSIELYDLDPVERTVAYSDLRDVKFGKLNGVSEPTDWQACETNHLGYLAISDNDLQLNPGFEVCMRNKGYVLSTEYSPLSEPTLSARTSGLRGSFQYATVSLDSELSLAESSLSP